MQHAYTSLSRSVEWFFTRWWGAGLYGASIAVLWALWGQEVADVWVSDISGPFLLVVLIQGSLVNAQATHAKLDCLTPDDRFNRIEDADEAEIEARRL